MTKEGHQLLKKKRECIPRENLGYAYVNPKKTKLLKIQLLNPGLTIWLVYGLPQGEKLDDGCSAEDYRIKVGFGNCTVVDFASNQLSCEPPTVKPEVDVEDIVHCGNSTSTLAVMVGPFIIIIIIIIVIIISSGAYSKGEQGAYASSKSSIEWIFY